MVRVGKVYMSHLVAPDHSFQNVNSNPQFPAKAYVSVMNRQTVLQLNLMGRVEGPADVTGLSLSSFARSMSQKMQLTLVQELETEQAAGPSNTQKHTT